MKRKYRSSFWFNNPKNPDMTALYLERYLNYGLKKEELQSGKPIIGIAQSGSDLVPCNRHFLELSKHIKKGIRDAGGIPMEFPTHPIQETGKRPTAALDRNLAYLSLVEVLYGYPLDGVVLTTGCDKTTPAALMAACTVNLPAIILSGGPMINGYHKGKKIGSGTIVWEARRMHARGEINYSQFIDLVAKGSPSIGHCNTMGTALTMNSVIEALGMSLPGCAAIPAPYNQRKKFSYETGKQIVEIVEKNLTPKKILVKKAFVNAIKVATLIGGSSNCPPHLIAIARHVGVKLDLNDWQKEGYNLPLIVDCQPSGKHLGEDFYKAGGVQAIIKELSEKNLLNKNCVTVTGKKISENIPKKFKINREVIRNFDKPILKNAGFLVLKSNFFDKAIMKTSVISDEFRNRYLSNKRKPNFFKGKIVVFEGPEDYHKRINDKKLNIDEYTILVIRNCGPVGYPGSAEVVNMQPPNHLLKKGIKSLPCLGDGRQSGTSESPSILNISPESAVGGTLAILKNNDYISIDLKKREVKLIVSSKEINRRRKNLKKIKLDNQTPWQELSRKFVGQLSSGACLEFAVNYDNIIKSKGLPRNSH